MRRWLRIFAITAVVIGLVAIALLGLLATPRVTTDMVRRAIERLPPPLDTGLRTGRVAVSPFGGRVTVADPVLRAPGDGARPLLTANRATIDVGGVPPAVRAIHLEAPRIHLVRDASGKTNLERLLAALPGADTGQGAEGASGPAAWPFDRLTFDHAVISLTDEGSGVEATIRDATGRIDRRGGTASLGFQAGGGQIRVDGRTLAIQEARLTGVLDASTLAIDQLRARVADVTMSAKGAIRGLDGTPRWDLAGNVSGPLAVLRPWLGTMVLEGAVSADWQLTGPLARPVVGAGITARLAKLGDLHDVRAAGHLRFAERQVTLRDARVLVAGGQIGARASYNLDASTLTATITPRGVPLAPLARAAHQRLPAGLGGRLAGDVTVTLRLPNGKPPADLASAARAKGWVELAGTLPVGPGATPATVRTRFRWTGSQLRATGLRARLLGGEVTGTATATPAAAGKPPGVSVKADVVARGVDLDAVGDALRSTLPASGLVGGTFHVAVGPGADDLVVHGNALASGRLRRGVAGNVAPLPFAGRATLRLANEVVALSAARVEVLGGVVTARGTVPTEARLVPAGVRLELVARGIDLARVDRAFAVAPGPLDGQASGEVTVRGREIVVRRGRAAVFQGTLTADGRLVDTPGGVRFDMRLAGGGIDVARALRAAGTSPPPLDARLGGSWRLSGTSARPHLAGAVTVAGTLRAPEGPLPIDIGGTFQASPRGMSTPGLVANIGPARLRAVGRASLEGPSDMAVTGTLGDDPAVARALGLPVTPRGTRLTARLRGPAGRIEVAATLTAERVAPRGADVPRIESPVLTMGGHVGGGRIALLGKLAGQVIPPAAAPRRPPTASADGAQPGRPLAARWSYNASLGAPADGRLAIAAFALPLGDGEIAGRGSFDLATRCVAAQARTIGLDLGDVWPGAAAGGLPPTVPVAAEVDLSGTPGALCGTVNAHLAPFERDGTVVPGSDLKGVLATNSLALTGHLFGRQIEVDGQVATEAPYVGRVRLRADSPDLGPAFALAGATVTAPFAWPEGGAMAGVIEFAGPFGRHLALQGKVDLTTLRLRFTDLTLAAEGPLRASLGAGRLVVDRAHLVGGGTDMQAHGAMPLPGSQATGRGDELTASGTLDLALARALFPQAAEGVGGSLALEGTWRGPTASTPRALALNVRGGEVRLDALPYPLRDVRAAIRVVADRLFIEQMEAQAGRGSLRITGGGALDPGGLPRALDLVATARSLGWRTGGAHVLADADLDLTGQIDALSLVGEVRVLDGAWNRSFPTGGGGSGSGPAGKPSALDRLALRVHVMAPEPLPVRNDLVDTRVRGDLMVLGTLAEPGALGRVEAVGGELTFQDRRLQIQEASVDFTRPDRLAPRLHFMATSTIQGYEVSMRANGEPSALVVTLNSQPPLPQGDLLALVATGQTAGQLATAGGGVATASAILLSQLARGVERGVLSRGIIDELRIQTATKGGPGVGGADGITPPDATDEGVGRLTVGKRINDRLSITYSQDLAMPGGKPPGRTVVFDYMLTDRLQLELEQQLGQQYVFSARYRVPIR